ncbi:hypothetical protein N431DRAFT_178122 [Stipitochalara longipes BDJ]|nr:hypothetical protein N431DRAFT_178122 [Stipitochalara longipes BDJ]
MSANSPVDGYVQQPAVSDRHFQPRTTQFHLSDGSFPELEDAEPAPNRIRPMTWGPLPSRNVRTPQPTAIHYVSQPYEIYCHVENERPMGNGLSKPISDGSAIQTPDAVDARMIPNSRFPGNMQAKKRGYGEMAKAGPITTVPKRKKKVFPGNAQNDHANQVKEIGACARCRKEHIKCGINPENPEGPCLTCLVSRSRRLDKQRLCFRGKVTGVVLFRNIVDSDYGTLPFSETFDFGVGILKPFEDWDAKFKDVELTRGFGRTFKVRLRFLKAKALSQADISEPQRECPWALADFTGTIERFRKFLWERVSTEVGNKIGRTERPLDQMACAIFARAYQLAKQNEGRCTLLKEALMLWSCSRHIEGEWYFHGSETLGRETNDEGKVPLTAAPILDDEISSIIVKHHLPYAQTSVLEEIQKLLDRNNSTRQKRIFELFLAYFILLYNCEYMMKHQRKWAIHNNSPFRYTPKMMKLVKGILHTVNTILHVWRSDLKGQFPFSPQWDPHRGPKVADFSQEQFAFLKAVGKRIEGKEADFNRLFQSWENYDQDYCFTGQLFVRDGRPFDSGWLPMSDMPEHPPAPI